MIDYSVQSDGTDLLTNGFQYYVVFVKMAFYRPISFQYMLVIHFCRWAKYFTEMYSAHFM